MKLIVILFTIHSFALCAFERRLAGARQTGLGGAGAALASEPWCMIVNPAAAASTALDRACAFTVAPAAFGLGELSAAAALALVQTPAGALGVSAEKFGCTLYREITATAVVARSFADFDVGVGLSFQSVTIPGYGSAAAIGLNGGVCARVTKGLAVAAAVRNINGPRLGAAQEPVPQEFRAALAYRAAPLLTLAADYSKESSFDPAASFGCEMQVVDACALRIGFSELPALTCAGLGLRVGIVRIDYAATYHADLGVSHVATLSLVWSR